jgi:hypothetical protein
LLLCRKLLDNSSLEISRPFRSNLISHGKLKMKLVIFLTLVEIIRILNVRLNLYTDEFATVVHLLFTILEDVG